jgi:hypothetical protein
MSAIGDAERKVAEMQRDFAEGRDLEEGAQTDEQRVEDWLNTMTDLGHIGHWRIAEVPRCLLALLADIRADERRRASAQGHAGCLVCGYDDTSFAGDRGICKDALACNERERRINGRDGWRHVVAPAANERRRDR